MAAKLTPEIRDQLVAAWLSGDLVADISKSFGVSYVLAGQIARRRGHKQAEREANQVARGIHKNKRKSRLIAEAFSPPPPPEPVVDRTADVLRYAAMKIPLTQIAALVRMRYRDVLELVELSRSAAAK